MRVPLVLLVMIIFGFLLGVAWGPFLQVHLR